MRSETTRDKAGALPPKVYYTHPPHSKVMFHDDSTVEGREGIEQIMPQVSDDDGGSHVSSITFVDDSTVEIVAVGEVPDQEDEYDTDSPIWMMTITTLTPTQQNSPGLVTPFALIFALTFRVCTIGRAHIHYLVKRDKVLT